MDLELIFVLLLFSDGSSAFNGKDEFKAQVLVNELANLFGEGVIKIGKSKSR